MALDHFFALYESQQSKRKVIIDEEEEGPDSIDPAVDSG